jgi:hypothetical protein
MQNEKVQNKLFMKTKIQKTSRLLMLTLFLTLIGCSEDVYENHIHNNNTVNKNSISFKKFKGETGIKNFESLKSLNLGNEFSRSIESEFVTDTTKIKKYTSLNNNVTYSFKIYPITEALKSKEYYNLVYEKYGNEWNELIFLNKEKETPHIGESKLESSKMVYNKKLSAMNMAGFCEITNYTNGSCTCIDKKSCDWCIDCVTSTVSYFYCGNSGNLEALPLSLVDSPGNIGGGGAGNNYSGIYIPNPYDGDDNLNNPDFVYTNQVAAFTRTLHPNLKKLLTNNFWIYQNIVDFIINNGGLTQENKDAVVFALTNSIPIFNLSLPNWTFTDINQLQYNAFIFLLQNPNLQGQAGILQIANNINHVFTPDIDFAIFSTSYFLNHPNTTDEQFQNWFMTPSEGKEDIATSNLSDLNLTFPTQNLPTFDDFILAFPSHLDTNFTTAEQVYTSVGGAVLTKYNQGARNTCALRISKGLNYSGITIPNIPGVTVKGADNKNYFLVAKNLLTWMKNTFGTPTGSNHLTGSQGGAHGENFPTLLNGKQGIYIMIPTDPSSSGFDASGHADMFFSGDCDGGCYFNATGGVSEIFFWELP